MFSKEEIQARFHRGDRPIDRHGNEVFIGGDFYTSMAQFPLLAHYHILNGLTDEKVLHFLRAADLSAFESNYVLKNCHSFIKDVLEIDVAEYRANRHSTAAMCGQLVGKVVAAIETLQATKRDANIIVDGLEYQVNARTREALGGYMMAQQCPEYWVLADNDKIEFNSLKLLNLQTAIVARDAEIHAEVTGLKREARTYAEHGQYTQLVALADKVNA